MANNVLRELVMRIDEVGEDDLAYLNAHYDVTFCSHLPYVRVRAYDYQIKDIKARLKPIIVKENAKIDRRLVYSLATTKAYVARSRGWLGNGQKVAVIDSTLDPTDDIFRYEENGQTIEKVEQVVDITGLGHNVSLAHGTNIGGIIAAMVPRAKIFGLNVFQIDPLDGSEFAYAFDSINAFNWIIDYNTLNPTAPILFINYSMGSLRFYTGTCDGEVIADAINQLYLDYGITTCVASGNEGKDTELGTPACASFCVPVGSTFSSYWGVIVGDGEGAGTIEEETTPLTVTSYTNVGTLLKIVAPGSFIDAGGYKLEGTSMATPHVTAALVALKQKNPSMDGLTLADILYDTGIELYVDRSSQYVHLIDMDAATA